MNTPKKRKIDPNNRPGKKYIFGRPMTYAEKIQRNYARFRERVTQPPVSRTCECGNKATKWDHGDAVCDRCAALQTHLRNSIIGLRCVKGCKPEADKWHYVAITPKPLRVLITEALNKLIIDAHGHYEFTI